MSSDKRSSKRPVTVPVRIPDDIYADLRRWAQLRGLTPGELMEAAWREWVTKHKAEILADIDALRAEVQAR